jgi:hypothetical protein
LSGSKFWKSQFSHQHDGSEDVEMTEEEDNWCNDDTNEGDSKPSPCS